MYDYRGGKTISCILNNSFILVCTYYYIYYGWHSILYNNLICVIIIISTRVARYDILLAASTLFVLAARMIYLGIG